MLSGESGESLERYSRLVLVRGIGLKGLIKLRKARIAVIGCGAVGSTQAELLARLGVGFIRVIDEDRVEVSNLVGAHIFDQRDALEAAPKALACASKIREINPDVEVEPVVERVKPSNIVKLLGDVDIVLDGTDSIPARLLINDASIKLGKPWIFTGVASWYGNVMLVKPREGPCFRCILPHATINSQGNVCETIGMFTPTVTMVASIAVALAVKLIVAGESEHGTLFIVNGRDLTIERFSLKRSSTCPACSTGRLEFLEGKFKEALLRDPCRPRRG